MRNIMIYIFFAFIFCNTAFAQSVSEEEFENDQWDFITKYYYIKKQLALPDTCTLRIALDGSFNYQDSLCIIELSSELNELMERIKIVDSFDPADITVTLHFLTYSDSKLFGRNPATGWSCGNRQDNRIKNINSHIFLEDTLDQAKRNNFIRHSFIREVLQIKLIGNIDDTLFQNKYGNSLILGKQHSKSVLSDFDKDVIRKVYKNEWRSQLFWNRPEHYVRLLQNKYNPRIKYSYLLLMYILIAIIFLLAFKKGVFKPFHTFRRFNLQVFPVALGYGIMIMMLNLWQHNIFGLEGFWHPFFTFLMGFLSTYLISNIIYWVEKITLKKINNISQRVLVEIIISLIITFLYLFLFIHAVNLEEFFDSKFLFVFIIVVVRAMLHFMNYQVQNAVKEKDLELMRIQNLQQQSELQAIHSRINPHFLYNSLNSIASLAKPEPNKTEQMALALSDFCRYAMNKKDEIFAPIKEELEVIRNYLSIEKIRFSDKLKYRMNCDDEMMEYNIPRFLLQPLVENAIKHGTSNKIENGSINIEISPLDNFLSIKIFDNGPDFPETPIFGFGLQSIYDKLEIHYKGQASINWFNNPDKYIEIKIPLV